MNYLNLEVKTFEAQLDALTTQNPPTHPQSKYQNKLQNKLSQLKTEIKIANEHT